MVLHRNLWLGAIKSVKGLYRTRIGSGGHITLNDEGSENVWFYEEGAQVRQAAFSSVYVFGHWVVLPG
jgi:hypothetical protein